VFGIQTTARALYLQKIVTAKLTFLTFDVPDVEIYDISGSHGREYEV
jgi:hypothetical protein